MDQTAFYRMTYGVFLLSAREGDKDNGCIINTAVQVANNPTRVSIAVIKENYTCGMIERTGLFNLTSLTEETSFDLLKHFGMQSGRDVNKFEGQSAARAENDLLYLTESANMYMSCRVTEQMDLGSHMLFIGEVTEAEVLGSAPSCSYGYYQTVIKPKPQPVAKKAWVCAICGYVYEGDEVPDDFICPLCRHGKEDFVLADPEAKKEEPATAPAAADRWVCPTCGYVFEGEAVPEDFVCPWCGVPGSKFVQEA